MSLYLKINRQKQFVKDGRICYIIKLTLDLIDSIDSELRLPEDVKKLLIIGGFANFLKNVKMKIGFNSLFAVNNEDVLSYVASDGSDSQKKSENFLPKKNEIMQLINRRDELFVVLEVRYNNVTKEIRTKNSKSVVNFLDDDLNHNFDSLDKTHWLFVKINGYGEFPLKANFKIDFVIMLIKHLSTQFGGDRFSLLAKRRYFFEKYFSFLKFSFSKQNFDNIFQNPSLLDTIEIEYNYSKFNYLYQKVDFLLNNTKILDDLISISTSSIINSILFKLQPTKYDERIPYSVKREQKEEIYWKILDKNLIKIEAVGSKESYHKLFMLAIKPVLHLVISNTYNFRAKFCALDHLDFANSDAGTIYLNQYSIIMMDSEGNWFNFSYDQLENLKILKNGLLEFMVTEQVGDRLKGRMVKIETEASYGILEDINFYSRKLLRYDPSLFYGLSYLTQHSNNLFEELNLDFGALDYFTKKSIEIVTEYLKLPIGVQIGVGDQPNRPEFKYRSKKFIEKIEKKFKRKPKNANLRSYPHYIYKKKLKEIKDKELADHKLQILHMEQETEAREKTKTAEKKIVQVPIKEQSTINMLSILSKALMAFPGKKKKEKIEEDSKNTMSFNLSNALKSFPGKKKKA